MRRESMKKAMFFRVFWVRNLLACSAQAYFGLRTFSTLLPCCFIMWKRRGSRDRGNKMPISFPCMLKEKAERHCLRKRGGVVGRKGQCVRRPTSKFVRRKEETVSLRDFYKLMILLHGSLRFQEQDLEQEKQISIGNFPMFYEKRQWPGVFCLPKLYTKGLDRGFGFKCFGILLPKPFISH